MSRISIRPFYDAVAEFTAKNNELKGIEKTPLELRKKLITEEINELEAEIFREYINRENLCKEICDVIYVVVGGILEYYPARFGNVTLEKNTLTSNEAFTTMLDSSFIYNKTNDKQLLFTMLNSCLVYAFYVFTEDELFKAFDLVHQSNMQKFENAKFDENGKLMKGESVKPDLSFLVKKPKVTKRKTVKKTEND